MLSRVISVTMLVAAVGLALWFGPESSLAYDCLVSIAALAAMWNLFIYLRLMGRRKSNEGLIYTLSYCAIFLLVTHFGAVVHIIQCGTLHLNCIELDRLPSEVTARVGGAVHEWIPGLPSYLLVEATIHNDPWSGLIEMRPGQRYPEVGSQIALINTRDIKALPSYHIFYWQQSFSPQPSTPQVIRI